MLKITQAKGFQLTFENGLTISVQFGKGNYCENRNFFVTGTDREKEYISSKDAEIAIWNKEGNWYDFGSDTVNGWVNSNDVAKWIYAVSIAKDIEDIKKV